MKSRNLGNEESHWSREEIRTVFWFWLFWSAYLLLSAILIASLLTDWPAFLHNGNPYFR